MQFELFAEAGALVAARLAREDAAEEDIAAVLQRAATQASSVATQRNA